MAWEAREEDPEKEEEDEKKDEEDERSSPSWRTSSLKVEALVIPCLLL